MAGPLKEQSSQFRPPVESKSRSLHSNYPRTFCLLSLSLYFYSLPLSFNSHVLHNNNLHSNRIEEKSGVKTIPEMTFGENFLRVTHAASGFTLNVNVTDALQACRTDGSSETIQTAVAKEWKEKRISHSKAKVIDFGYDWTYTTDYNGQPREMNTKDSGSENEINAVAETEKDEEREKGSDKVAEFVDDASALIDIPLLMRRDPIVWYTDLPLFESELDDNGVSQLSVKLRVMPTCFLILIRFFLRVDGVLIRLYDTRVFHKFGANEVVREQTLRECPATGRYQTASADDFRAPPDIERVPLKARYLQKCVLKKNKE